MHAWKQGGTCGDMAWMLEGTPSFFKTSANFVCTSANSIRLAGSLCNRPATTPPTVSLTPCTTSAFTRSNATSVTRSAFIRPATLLLMLTVFSEAACDSCVKSFHLIQSGVTISADFTTTSYKIAPRDQWSFCKVGGCSGCQVVSLSNQLSGARNSGVLAPHVVVRSSASPASFTKQEVPKSPTFARHNGSSQSSTVKKICSGLRSPWRIPWRCIAAVPATMSLKRRKRVGRVRALILSKDK
mmetsp:Transcript_68825/g.136166  ORF Transcript_68825/g.136166 Transcript_68825/m.136166 type:complete len:242 (-) Transcript_68825:418-1143(-)